MVECADDGGHAAQTLDLGPGQASQQDAMPLGGHGQLPAQQGIAVAASRDQNLAGAQPASLAGADLHAVAAQLERRHDLANDSSPVVRRDLELRLDQRAGIDVAGLALLVPGAEAIGEGQERVEGAAALGIQALMGRGVEAGAGVDGVDVGGQVGSAQAAGAMMKDDAAGTLDGAVTPYGLPRQLPPERAGIQHTRDAALIVMAGENALMRLALRWLIGANGADI